MDVGQTCYDAPFAHYMSGLYQHRLQKKKKYRKKEGFSKVTLHRHKANFKGSEKILRILIGSQILIHEVLKDS